MAIMYALTGRDSLDERLFSDGLTFAMVEGPAAAEFLDIRDPDFRSIALEYPSGLAFGPTRSVRWLKRRDGKYHLVVIDDEPSAPQDAPRLPLELLPDEQPSQLLLAGKRSQGRLFEEGRIPNNIEYPDDSDSAHLAVEIRHYLGTDGAMRVWRCVRIKPV